MTCPHNYLGESTCEHCGANEADGLRGEVARLRSALTAAAEALEGAEEWLGREDGEKPSVTARAALADGGGGREAK